MTSKEKVTKFVKGVLQVWDSQSRHIPHAHELRLVKAELAKKGQPSETNLRISAKAVIKRCIDLLNSLNEIEGGLIQNRYIDGLTRKGAATALGLSDNQAKHLMSTALKSLVDLVFEEETIARNQHYNQLTFSLPQQLSTPVFGIGRAIHDLGEQLLMSDISILSLVGIGGIGKSTLCYQISKQLLKSDNFDKVVWLTINNESAENNLSSAKLTGDKLLRAITQQLAPRASLPIDSPTLRHMAQTLLNQQPTLLIVDNVELSQDVEFIVHYLQDFLTPSQLIITSRSRPRPRNGLLQQSLTELPEVAALELIRHHATVVQSYDLTVAPDDLLQPILTMVGGNPYAIKLIVGLTATLSLDAILQDLAQVQNKSIEAMYHHIFWRTWSSLAKPAKLILLAMPLASASGMTLKNLTKITELQFGKAGEAIDLLNKLSLLDIGGSSFARRYSSHQLVITFVNSNIVDSTISLD